MLGAIRFFPLLAVGALAACGPEQQREEPPSQAEQLGTPVLEPEPDCQTLEAEADRLEAEADSALAVFWRYRERHVEPAQDRWLAERERGRPARAERQEVDRVTAQSLRLQREQEEADRAATLARRRAASCEGPKALQANAKTPQTPTSCEQAFADAARVSSYRDTHEDLFPAFSACKNVSEWKSANALYPEAIDGWDPVDYARNVCDSYRQELGGTEICNAVGLPSWR